MSDTFGTFEFIKVCFKLQVDEDAMVVHRLLCDHHTYLPVFSLFFNPIFPHVFPIRRLSQKIADFGFSALFRELESESSSGEDSSGPSSSTGGAVRGSRAFPLTAAGRARAAGVGGVAGGAGAGGAGVSGGKGLGRGVRRLTSVVGSPYYVAPEVRLLFCFSFFYSSWSLSVSEGLVSWFLGEVVMSWTWR